MTQILRNLYINGFRGFQEITLADFADINIIVGMNNSGKTSLLEAIGILCNPLNPFVWFEVSQRKFTSNKGFFRNTPNSESLKWIFSQNKNSNNEQFDRELNISCDGGIFVSNLKAKLSEIFSLELNENIENLDIQSNNEEQFNEDKENEDYNKKGLELSIEISYQNKEDEQQSLFEKKDIAKSFEFWENDRFVYRKPENPFIKTKIISPSYSGSESVQLSQAILSEDKDIKNEILELIQFFDSDILDLIILFPKEKYSGIYIDHKKLGITPLYVLGDGIKKTMAIAIAIQSAENGILMIDEIETSFHVSILQSIFSWLVKSCLSKNIQLFITTHSIEAVDAIIESDVDINKIVAFQLNNGNKRIKRFSGKLVKELRFEGGLDIR